MGTLKEQREAAAAKANAIAELAKSENRQVSAEEVGQIRAFVEEIKGFDLQMKAANEAHDLLASIGQSPAFQNVSPDDAGAKALGLGSFFQKNVGEKLMQAKGQRFSLSAPEYKAATDTHLTSTLGANGIILPQYDMNIVDTVKRRLTIADLLGSGTLTSNAITYFTESPDSEIEGAFTTVAEGAAKPQLHFPNYDPVTEVLKKIAGFIKISDEMTEDAAFLVSEIEGRLMYQLLLFEENQLLNGDGLGTNIKGLLNRTGLQTETAADNTDNHDALFRAITKVQTGAELEADGIVINPLDYQNFRLSKDLNGQYFAGGIFGGQYGTGPYMENPPLWGKRVVVTPAITAGTVLVGAFKQADTVYRKGGIRVEATNTEGNDFTNNKVTIRAEERLTLAVRRPAAHVVLTLSSTPPA